MSEPQDVLQAIRLALKGEEQSHSKKLVENTTESDVKPEDNISKEKKREKMS